MLGYIIGVLIAFAALIGAGVFSYTHLENRFGASVPSEVVPRIVTETAQTILQKSSEGALPKTSTETRVVVQKKSIPAKVALPVSVAITPKKVVVPGPLRAAPQQESAKPLLGVVLTAQGVLEHTNRARAEHGGFGALTHNETLDRVAMAKLLDMFAKQYFEHVSPTGIGPSDLAKTAGYAYVVVGENLALGNFGSDAKLVDAWMASPGHRANILNPRYQEIGIAAGRGIYEGRETWLAVQSFGMPLSACPALSSQKKMQIETNNTTIADMRTSLDIKKAQLDATSKTDSNYNIFVNEFNAIVAPYNSLIESNRVLVDEYNAEVQAFNACAAGTAV